MTAPITIAGVVDRGLGGVVPGGMILGLIATIIGFNGSLNGAWIIIIGGVLLFAFIVIERPPAGLLRLRGAA